MQLDLRWIASFSASCAHAVRAFWQGLSPADGKLATALAEPVERFLVELKEHRIPADIFLTQFLPLSAQRQSRRALVEVALKKSVGGDRHGDKVELLAAGLGDVERVFQQMHPKIVEELELRAPVLRDQWEARGPGLLNFVGKMTDEDLLVSRADIVLVHPLLGGGGSPHLLYNQVTIEAVLANPHVELPEVTRLAWLLAQLNMEIPAISEMINGSRLPRVAALSMIPATLAAAAEIDLASSSKEAVKRAIDVWLPAEADSEAVADPVWRWWDIYRGSRPAWPVALAALDRMLEDSP